MAAVAALALSGACAGCGLGAGTGTHDVNVRVTRDFGAHAITTVDAGTVSGQQTAMQLLQHHLRVTTRYGGGFVESIDGRSGTGDHYDWFFYVDGVQSGTGAAAVDVHRGERIWWDLHDWKAAASIPAVVGSFPEPFSGDSDGRRTRPTVQCGSGLTAACRAVTGELDRLKIPVAAQAIGAGTGSRTPALVVGTWTQVKRLAAARAIAAGPRTSGVYATLTGAGTQLRLLDPAGAVVRALGPGAGLIAATAENGGEPTWLVTGTDRAGVQAAARALTPSALAGHFALALQGSARFALPVAAGSQAGDHR